METFNEVENAWDAGYIQAMEVIIDYIHWNPTARLEAVAGFAANSVELAEQAMVDRKEMP